MAKATSIREKSPRTQETYLAAVDVFLASAGRRGIRSLAEVTPIHLREWLADMADRGNSDGTRFNRYNGVKALFRWSVSEELIERSPFDKAPPPRPKPQPVPVLSEQQLAAMFKTTSGRDFESVRDRALLILLIDTGMRRAEAAGLKGRLTPEGTFEGDIDLDLNTATVLGKGGVIRACPFGAKTGLAIGRYLRARAAHPFHFVPNLWLGQRGALKPNGIPQIIRRRAQEAGIGKAWTHMFRHTWASLMLSDGLNQLDVQRLGAWKRSDMLLRYGSGQADQRARAAYVGHAPGDRL